MSSRDKRSHLRLERTDLGALLLQLRVLLAELIRQWGAHPGRGVSNQGARRACREECRTPGKRGSGEPRPRERRQSDAGRRLDVHTTVKWLRAQHLFQAPTPPKRPHPPTPPPSHPTTHAPVRMQASRSQSCARPIAQCPAHPGSPCDPTPPLQHPTPHPPDAHLLLQLLGLEHGRGARLQLLVQSGALARQLADLRGGQLGVPSRTAASG